MAINRGFDPRAAMAASNPAAYAKAQGLQDRVAAVQPRMPQGQATTGMGSIDQSLFKMYSPEEAAAADQIAAQQRAEWQTRQSGAGGGEFASGSLSPAQQQMRNQFDQQNMMRHMQAQQSGMGAAYGQPQQRMGGLLGAPMPQQMGGGQDDWASRYTYGAHMQPQQQQPQRSGAMYQHGMQQAAMQRQPMQQFGGGYGQQFMPQQRPQFMPQQSPYSLGFGSQQMMQRPQFMPQQYGGGGYGGGYGMPQQRQQYGYAGPQGGRGYDIQGTARTRQFTGYPQDIFLGM